MRHREVDSISTSSCRTRLVVAQTTMVAAVTEWRRRDPRAQSRKTGFVLMRHRRTTIYNVLRWMVSVFFLFSFERMDGKKTPKWKSVQHTTWSMYCTIWTRSLDEQWLFWNSGLVPPGTSSNHEGCQLDDKKPGPHHVSLVTVAPRAASTFVPLCDDWTYAVPGRHLPVTPRTLVPRDVCWTHDVMRLYP